MSVADGKGIGLLVHNFIDDDHDADYANLVMSYSSHIVIKLYPRY